MAGIRSNIQFFDKETTPVQEIKKSNICTEDECAIAAPIKITDFPNHIHFAAPLVRIMNEYAGSRASMLFDENVFLQIARELDNNLTISSGVEWYLYQSIKTTLKKLIESNLVKIENKFKLIIRENDSSPSQEQFRSAEELMKEYPLLHIAMLIGYRSCIKKLTAIGYDVNSKVNMTFQQKVSKVASENISTYIYGYGDRIIRNYKKKCWEWKLEGHVTPLGCAISQLHYIAHDSAEVFNAKSKLRNSILKAISDLLKIKEVDIALDSNFDLTITNTYKKYIRSEFKQIESPTGSIDAAHYSANPMDQLDLALQDIIKPSHITDLTETKNLIIKRMQRETADPSGCCLCM